MTLTSLSITDEPRLAALIAEFTLDEKASLTSGEDMWHLPAIKRLGLGRLKLSDGPSGVRGEKSGTVRSLSFPCGMAAGSTWDTDLLELYGEVLANEARRKSAHVLLGPTVCIARTPLAGRTFESYSEDPLLSAQLAVSYIRGVQSSGVGCCVKHFACNDQESERMTISVEVDERTLREIHLPSFEAAVRDAGVWSMMTSYNKVNGTYSSEHPQLIGEILNSEWGFDGVVMSDWGATHSTVGACIAGLDLEMPGPARYLGSSLANAVRAGDVDEDILDDHVERILRLMYRCGTLDNDVSDIESSEDDPQSRSIARRLAISGTVMLRNDGVLPISPKNVKKIAVIGPNADLLEIQGGGSAGVFPHRYLSIVDELRSRLDGVEVVHEVGCRFDRGVPVIDPRLLGNGIQIEYFANPDLRGDATATDDLNQGIFISIGDPAPGVPGSSFSLRAQCTFSPDVSGSWQLGMGNVGIGRLLVDGAVFIDGSTFSRPIEFEAGSTHELVVELRECNGIASFRLAAARPEIADSMDRGVAAARESDVAIVVVGSNKEWETEGVDRTDLRLIGNQDALIQKVVEANPRTIVIVNAGAPVEMPWVNDTAAILMAWYPGEEGAPALADIVTGIADPGGRLPITFPRRREDSATHGFYPGSQGKVEYGEGIFVGYRHFDANNIEPEFCFGHGLSYTRFAYSEPTVNIDGESVIITVPVTNIGDQMGSEVVQLYVSDLEASVARPLKELKSFAKVELDSQETTNVILSLDERSFAFWDDKVHGWRVEPGDFVLEVGSSSRDIRHRIRIQRGEA